MPGPGAAEGEARPGGPGPRVVRGAPVIPGAARGPCLVLTEPLSLWGGLDPATGDIVDPRHPQHGRRVTGQVLVMPSGRGSSSSSSILLEALYAGTGPAALVLGRSDHILPLGGVVADEVFGLRMPLVVVKPEDLDAFRDGADVEVRPDGTLALDGVARRPEG